MGMSPIKQVLIYSGHSGLGPFPCNVPKTIKLFSNLGSLRTSLGGIPWTITPFDGSSLQKHLSRKISSDSLLVIPAGPSSELDKAFSAKDIESIQAYLAEGGRLFLTCGSAYWASKVRIFDTLSESASPAFKTMRKTSKIPLFDGYAEGPLFPYPNTKHRVSFKQEDVLVRTESGATCFQALVGGGAFIPSTTSQSIKVLLEYNVNRHPIWKNAAIRINNGPGSVLMTMVHPEYGPSSPSRLTFTLKHLIEPLEY
ncbi:MAG: hypothetical protein SP1CHLAM54_10090 [Chlamydiia bacterium]|nr:hypothetical protein [Chlamydiia bacterium]MCH9615915.1 hypothetical protein [Chlamydiia bacterium]MCH9628682.1 hypothetical protein [Chlamydiia bacterium]